MAGAPPREAPRPARNHNFIAGFFTERAVVRARQSVSVIHPDAGGQQARDWLIRSCAGRDGTRTGAA